MKKRWLVGIGAVVVVGVIAFSIFGGGLGPKNAKGEKPVQVKTALASKGEVDAYLSTTAVIKSDYKKEYFGSQAKVEKVNVEVGDKVKKGDVLVVFEKQDTLTQVRQAEIQYENAKLSNKELNNQNQDIKDQIADLAKQISDLKKSGTPADLTKADQLKKTKDSLSPISSERLKQSSNAILSAKLSLNSARSNNVKNTNDIVAEAAGTVTAVNVTEGANASGGQAAIVVQDLKNLKAVITLGKYDATRVKLNQSVKISVGRSGSATSKVLSGKVSFIDPVATISQNGEALLKAEIIINKYSSLLKIDFSVDVDILTGKALDAISVPAEAVRYEKAGRTTVYVVKDGMIEIREAKLGISSDVETQIIQGVIEGEKVVLNPETTLINGTKVFE